MPISEKKTEQLTHCILAPRDRERVILLNNEAIFTDLDLKFAVNKNSDSMTLKLYQIRI